MRRAAVGSVWVALVLTAGCAPAPPAAPGGSGSPSSPAGSGDAAGSAFGPIITFSEETAAAAEATATFDEGGTVKATASDGTTFELALPGGAVLDDTVIRMTPLADVKAAGDGAVHAVKLEPEGLHFNVPVRLTITPAAAIPLENQVMFHAKASGDDVAAALVDVASEPIVILVEHFSVAGAGYAQKQAAWLINHARERLDQLSHEVAKVLQEERRRQLVEGEENPDVMDEVEKLFDVTERDVLSYLRQAAALTCAATEAYVHGLIALESQREIIGLASAATKAAMDAEVLRAIDASFKLCETEKIQECRAKKDPAILAKFWIGWDRQRALRGENTPVAAVGDFEARARKLCATDYKIDKTVAGTENRVSWTIRYTATKCGSPVGDWVIDSAGTLSGFGGTATIGGPVSVEIAEGTLTGPVEGTANFDDENQGHTEGHFVGTATFVQDPQTLEAKSLDLKITSGSGSGYAYGFLDTGPTKPGTLTFPVEQGKFC